MTPSTPPPTSPRRLGFAGTPEFAARILAALIAAGQAPAVVYTQPDRPTGRGRKVRPSPVKVLAMEHGLALEQPASLGAADVRETLAGWALDVLVVAAYGLILPPAILALPRFGCINVHASLLPRWRGAAPVERAIMAGDPETGVCIMRMERGLDTGPVYACRRTPIDADDDGESLEARLADLGGACLLDCLGHLGTLTPTPQAADGVSYAHKLTSADAVIDWTRPAPAIERQVRALRGRLPARSHAGTVQVTVLEARAEHGGAASADHSVNHSVDHSVNHLAKPGTVLAAARDGIRIACGEGVLRVLRLRLNVGKGTPLSAAAAINGYGHLFLPNERLGEPQAGS